MRADANLGKAQAVIEQRERIKRQIIGIGASNTASSPANINPKIEGNAPPINATVNTKCSGDEHAGLFAKMHFDKNY